MNPQKEMFKFSLIIGILIFMFVSPALGDVRTPYVGVDFVRIGIVVTICDHTNSGHGRGGSEWYRPS